MYNAWTRILLIALLVDSGQWFQNPVYSERLGLLTSGT